MIQGSRAARRPIEAVTTFIDQAQLRAATELV
jgi:hypothetical protein